MNRRSLMTPPAPAAASRAAAAVLLPVLAAACAGYVPFDGTLALAPRVRTAAGSRLDGADRRALRH